MSGWRNWRYIHVEVVWVLWPAGLDDPCFAGLSSQLLHPPTGYLLELQPNSGTHVRADAVKVPVRCVQTSAACSVLEAISCCGSLGDAGHVVVAVQPVRCQLLHHLTTFSSKELATCKLCTG